MSSVARMTAFDALSQFLAESPCDAQELIGDEARQAVSDNPLVSRVARRGHRPFDILQPRDIKAGQRGKARVRHYGRDGVFHRPPQLFVGRIDSAPEHPPFLLRLPLIGIREAAYTHFEYGFLSADGVLGVVLESMAGLRKFDITRGVRGKAGYQKSEVIGEVFERDNSDALSAFFANGGRVFILPLTEFELTESPPLRVDRDGIPESIVISDNFLDTPAARMAQAFHSPPRGTEPAAVAQTSDSVPSVEKSVTPMARSKPQTEMSWTTRFVRWLMGRGWR